MKKNYTLMLLLIAFGAMAQTDCDIKITYAKQIMESKALFKPYDKFLKIFCLVQMPVML